MNHLYINNITYYIIEILETVMFHYMISYTSKTNISPLLQKSRDEKASMGLRSTT